MTDDPKQVKSQPHVAPLCSTSNEKPNHKHRIDNKDISYAALCLTPYENHKPAQRINIKETAEFIYSEYFKKRETLQHNPIYENSTVVIPEIQITTELLKFIAKIVGEMWAGNDASQRISKIGQTGDYGKAVSEILEANFRSAGYIKTTEGKDRTASKKPEPIAAV